MTVVNSLEERRIMSKSIDLEGRSREVSSMGRKAWAVQEEVFIISSTPVWNEQNGPEHKKLCLNLCSWKSLNSIRSRVSSLIPVMSWMLKIDLLEGLIRSHNLFLNSDVVVYERSETSSDSTRWYNFENRCSRTSLSFQFVDHMDEAFADCILIHVQQGLGYTNTEETVHFSVSKYVLVVDTIFYGIKIPTPVLHKAFAYLFHAMPH